MPLHRWVSVGGQPSLFPGRGKFQEKCFLLQGVPVCIELPTFPILVVGQVLVYPRRRQFKVVFACLLALPCHTLLDLSMLFRCKSVLLCELDFAVRNHRLVLSLNLRREIKKIENN